MSTTLFYLGMLLGFVFAALFYKKLSLSAARKVYSHLPGDEFYQDHFHYVYCPVCDSCNAVAHYQVKDQATDTGSWHVSCVHCDYEGNHEKVSFIFSCNDKRGKGC